MKIEITKTHKKTGVRAVKEIYITVPTMLTVVGIAVCIYILLGR